MQEAEILQHCLSMHEKSSGLLGKSQCKPSADLCFSELYACSGKQLQQLQPPIIQTLCVSTQVGAK